MVTPLVSSNFSSTVGLKDQSFACIYRTQSFYCLSVFELRLMVTPLVYSTFSNTVGLNYQSFLGIFRAQLPAHIIIAEYLSQFFFLAELTSHAL